MAFAFEEPYIPPALSVDIPRRPTVGSFLSPLPPPLDNPPQLNISPVDVMAEKAPALLKMAVILTPDVDGKQFQFSLIKLLYRQPPLIYCPQFLRVPSVPCSTNASSFETIAKVFGINTPLPPQPVI